MIVAHGQPSDPGPAEAALAELAARVAAFLPGEEVGSATLAAPGALARAAAEAPGRVLPLFMAGGWFTRTHLPARLAEAGGAGWQVLEPLGCLPALHALCRQVVEETGAAEVLVAAHGSGRSPAPAAVAEAVARHLAAPGRRVATAYIEQAPRLEDVAGWGEGAVCLPFFAAAGAHVEEDLPAALARAGWPGTILPAIGLHPAIPALIAATLRDPPPACAADCRWSRAPVQAG
jgi:sirohydrochlorin ferrochelatase